MYLGCLILVARLRKKTHACVHTYIHIYKSGWTWGRELCVWQCAALYPDPPATQLYSPLGIGDEVAWNQQWLRLQEQLRTHSKLIYYSSGCALYTLHLCPIGPKQACLPSDCSWLAVLVASPTSRLSGRLQFAPFNPHCCGSFLCSCTVYRQGATALLVRPVIPPTMVQV